MPSRWKRISDFIWRHSGKLTALGTGAGAAVAVAVAAEWLGPTVDAYHRAAVCVSPETVDVQLTGGQSLTCRVLTDTASDDPDYPVTTRMARWIRWDDEAGEWSALSTSAPVIDGVATWPTGSQPGRYRVKLSSMAAGREFVAWSPSVVVP